MTVPTPTSTYEWPIRDEGFPLVSHVDGWTHRRLTIVPIKLRITHRGPGVGLSVAIDGETIKANGTPGQHRRTHVFYENAIPGRRELTIDDLPEWALPYVEHEKMAEREKEI